MFKHKPNSIILLKSRALSICTHWLGFVRGNSISFSPLMLWHIRRSRKNTRMARRAFSTSPQGNRLVNPIPVRGVPVGGSRMVESLHRNSTFKTDFTISLYLWNGSDGESRYTTEIDIQLTHPRTNPERCLPICRSFSELSCFGSEPKIWSACVGRWYSRCLCQCRWFATAISTLGQLWLVGYDMLEIDTLSY